jgi:outer membrane protein assembly factor BamB
MRYSRDELAAPVIDHASGLIFVGTSDSTFSAYLPNLRTIAWRIRLDGAPVAKPLLFKKSVLVGTSKGTLYAIDKATKNITWSTKLDSELASSPTLGNELVYLVTGLSTVYAIDPSDGSIRWSRKRTLPEGVYLRPESEPLFLEVTQLSYRKPVIVIGGALGNAQVLDAKNGTLLRDISVGNSKVPYADVLASPQQFKEFVVAAGYNNGLVAFSPLTGLEIWRFPLPEVTRLLVFGNTLFAAAKGEIVALSLGRTAKQVRRLWSFKYNRGAVSRFLLDRGHLFFSSSKGGLVELDANTGRPLSISGSPLGYSADGDLDADRVVFLSLGGRLTIWARDASRANRIKSGGFFD